MAEVKLKYFNDQTPLSNKMFLYYKKSKLKYTDKIFKPNDYSLFSKIKMVNIIQKNMGLK